jgi:broad specificity phosphatase PhoE
MPEARIILVRHGETEANRQRHFAASDDIPLTDTGRDQAHALALRLAREFRPQLLVSSEFLRARQTSEIIARVLGLAPFAIKGIHERDFGCLKGLPYEKLGELMSLDRPIQPWMWSPAGGESLEDVRRRSVQAIDALRDRYPDREIVVVCHGAVIQAICAHITGEWHESPVTANCGIVTITAQGILVCE